MGRQVEDVPPHFGVFLAHILVVECSVLGQGIHSYIEVVCFPDALELEPGGMDVIAVLRELAESYGISHLVFGLFHEAKYGIYVVAIGEERLGKVAIRLRIVYEGPAVVLAVTVAVLIAGLQVGAVRYGFAVTELCRKVVVDGRGSVVAVVLLVGAEGVIGDVGRRKLFAASLAVTACEAQGQVAPVVADLPVQL